MNKDCTKFFSPLICALRGVAIFYNLWISDSSSESERDNLRLGGYPFQFAWHTALNNAWPIIGAHELINTTNWVRAVNIGTRQVAGNRLERAIFALFHLCREDGIDPGTLIWAAHALEALYDLPVDQITKTVSNRIASVLRLNGQDRKPFVKRVRTFYEWRSAFAHGRLDITHPLNNDILDGTAYDFTGNLLDQIHIGEMLVIATLQQYVANNWRELAFREEPIGVPFLT